MDVRQLLVQNFRGFDSLHLKPRRHAVLIGEPRAGRSDVVEALARPLDIEGLGRRNVTELDFHNKSTVSPIQVELVVGDLGAELEQHFFEQLEVWDTKRGCLVTQADSIKQLEDHDHEWVLRLAYRADWRPAEGHADETVFYPKMSNPNAQVFARARRSDIARLNFRKLQVGTSRILDLAGRGPFREVVQAAGGDDFGDALEGYLEGVGGAAARFAESEQLAQALELIVEPLRMPFAMASKKAAELIGFEPEGGSLSGLLRSLGPGLDLGDSVGRLPTNRHGSTITNLLRLAEIFSLVAGSSCVIAVDDFGDGLDAASAAYFASVIRRSAGQVWITTRLREVAEVFDPLDIVRLARTVDGDRRPFQAQVPANKEELIAFRHWHKNLLPAMTYKTVIIVEGRHDLASLHALALRANIELDVPLPAANRTIFISADSEGSGGSSAVPRLATLAKTLGFRVVGVIDGDKSSQNQQHFDAIAATADAAIRLPEEFAIERAIVRGVPEDELRATISAVAQGVQITPPAHLNTLTGTALENEAISFLKRSPGHHVAFIESLPSGLFPHVALKLLATSLKAASEGLLGKIQLVE